MKCVSIQAPGQVEIHECGVPKPKPGEALLKMRYGGICGTDLGIYRGIFAYASYPRIIGHEISAEIVEIAPNDQGLKAGMGVTVNPYFNCGSCYSCRRGLVNACMSNKTLGVQMDGKFQEYFTIPIERIYDGKGISSKALAVVEPFCIAHHGVMRARPQFGEKVLIMGAGTIGTLAMMVANSCGAETYVSDVLPERLEKAKAMGAAGIICNTSPEAFEEAVRKITNGVGFDVAIEAVGRADTFQNCIDSAAFGGRVVLIGVSKQHLDFDFTVLQRKELNVFGSRNARKEDFLKVIDLIASNRVNVDSVITDVYPFEQAAEAFRQLDQNGAGKLKVLLEF